MNKTLSGALKAGKVLLAGAVVSATLIGGGEYLLKRHKEKTTFYDHTMNQFLSEKVKTIGAEGVQTNAEWDKWKCWLIERPTTFAREGILEMIIRENPNLHLRFNDLIMGDYTGLFMATLKVNGLKSESTILVPGKTYYIPHLILGDGDSTPLSQHR